MTMSLFTKQQDWYVKIGDKYKTVDILQWELCKLGSGIIVTVPKDFEFEVSVPKLLCWLFDPNDPRYLKAAALHDWTLEDGWDRVASAATFAEALRASKVGKLRRLIMVISVIAWNWT